MKLAVGTSTPAATIHAKNHNSAGSATLLVEDSAGNNIHNTLSSGYMQWGNNETLPRIYQTTTAGSSPNYTGGGLSIEGFFEAGASYDILGVTHLSETDGSDGPFSVLKVTGTHAPTSGSGDYVSIKVAPTINQTGTHSGDGFGIQVVPALTSIGDKYYAYYTAVNSSDAFGFAQAGSNSKNYFEGKVGIATSSPGTELHVVGTTSTTHLTGIGSSPTIGSLNSAIVGTGASASITGTDTGFLVTLTTGTGISTFGDWGTITLASSYGDIPVAMISCNNSFAAIHGKPGVRGTTTSTLTISAWSSLSNSTTYIWNIHVIGK